MRQSKWRMFLTITKSMCEQMLSGKKAELPMYLERVVHEVLCSPPCSGTTIKRYQ